MTQKGVWRLGAVAAAIVLLAAVPSFAQTTGRIEGRVLDSSGAVLPGATMTVSGPNLQGVRTTTTDQDGRFDVTILFEKGVRVRVEEDENADGKPQLVTLYSGEQITRREADTDGDGSLDTISSFEDGKERRQTRDLDGNGVPSTFRVSVTPDDTLTAKIDPNVVKVDPEE